MYSSERLNDLLIDVGRSLLQYVGESWPWTSEDEAGEQTAVERMVADERETVLELATFLDDRSHRISYGQYPSEYTSLHYVALDYLLDQLASEQRTLSQELSSAAGDAAGDDDAQSLLTSAAAQAKRLQGELEGLIAARKSPSAAAT